jgi:hypothetical protein
VELFPESGISHNREQKKRPFAETFPGDAKRMMHPRIFLPNVCKPHHFFAQADRFGFFPDCGGSRPYCCGGRFPGKQNAAFRYGDGAERHYKPTRVNWL